MNTELQITHRTPSAHIPEVSTTTDTSYECHHKSIINHCDTKEPNTPDTSKLFHRAHQRKTSHPLIIHSTSKTKGPQEHFLTKVRRRRRIDHPYLYSHHHPFPFSHSHPYPYSHTYPPPQDS